MPRTTTPRKRRLPPDFAAAPLVDAALELPLALDIVRQVEETRRPADHILRSVLRDADLRPEASAHVARAVFAWFRWRGFIAAGAGPGLEQLSHALELAEQFRREPESFHEVALRDRAAPGWLSRHMEISTPFARALQAEPVLWLRARRGRADEIAGALDRARAHLVAGAPDAVRYEGAQDLFRTRGFQEGHFEIQDIASQAVGVVCAPRPGETWWDACAGEGGKTLHLSELMHNRGLLWASDRSAGRLAVLRRRAARAGVFNYRISVWDGGARLPTRTRFDGVLVDAPCSGVGTWQRNPHARWMIGPADVVELAAVQRGLLETVAGAVKPGGRLIYAVCTLTRDETDDVADAFERARADFQPAAADDPFEPGKTGARFRWMPDTTGGNGMFVAVWRRAHA